MIVRKRVTQIIATRQGEGSIKATVQREVVVIAQRFGTVNIIRGDGVRVFGEVPSGVMNGSNATFVTAYNFVPESVQVFLNGLLQKIVSDYSTSGSTVIMLVSAPQAGENILVNYLKV